MTFSHDQLVSIPHILSEPRFATYLKYCNGNKTLALKLYKWNIELSSAFVIPLHILEISVRNAVVESLVSVHTSTWPWSGGLIRGLDKGSSISLKRIAKQEPTMGKVVAELKLIFWQKLFTARHDEKLWNQHIKTAFSHSPNTMSVLQLRSKIYNDISHIRKLRNRIAHHEPIFLRDVQSDYDKIYKLISWRNTTTAEWMNDFQTVTRLISEKPHIKVY